MTNGKSENNALCCCELYWLVVHWPIFQTFKLITQTFHKGLIIIARPLDQHLLPSSLICWAACKLCSLSLSWPPLSIQVCDSQFSAMSDINYSLSCSIRIDAIYYIRQQPTILLETIPFAWYLLWPKYLKQTIMFMQQTNKRNKYKPGARVV